MLRKEIKNNMEMRTEEKKDREKKKQKIPMTGEGRKNIS